MPHLDSMFSRKLTHPVLRYLAALVALVFLALAGVFGQVADSGQIVGNVTSRGSLLPGTTVTVTGPGLTRRVISDNEGRFEFSNLPAGTYTVTGTLPGFEPQSQPNIIVVPGRPTSVPLVLFVGCIANGDSIDLGMSRVLKEADTILYLRISTSGAPTRWSFGDWCVIGSEHTATVLGVVKTLPGQTGLGNTVRFVRMPDDLPPYAPGQEFVAMLHWEADAGRYRTIARFFMFPVRDGRVTWTRTDVPALKDAMPVADFISAWQASLKEPTQR